MRNCKTVNEFYYANDTYYEVLTRSGKQYFFKKDINDNYKMIKLEDYIKVYNLANEREEVKPSSVKNTLASIIIGSMIASSLVSCSAPNDSKLKATPRPTYTEQMTPTPNEDTNTNQEALNIADVDKYGIKVDLLENNLLDDQYSIYLIDKIDFSKIPDGSTLQKMIKEANLYFDYNMTDSINAYFDEEEEINKISELKISEKYKNIIINAIKAINSWGDNQMSSILYQNVMNMKVVIDYNQPMAKFDHIDKTLTIGRVDFDNDEVEFYRDFVGLNSKDTTTMQNHAKYVITHELGHASTACRGDNKEMISPAYAGFMVDKQTGNITSLGSYGSFIAEGLADYIEFEKNNYPCNQLVGYPMNQCYFLAIKNMLGLTTIGEVSKMNAKNVVDGLTALGIEKPIEYLFLLDRVISEEVGTMYANEATPSRDFTKGLVMLINEYITARLNAGDSIEEVSNVVDNIFNDIHNRVSVVKIEDKEFVLGSIGFEMLDYTEALNQVTQILDSKRNMSR